MGFFLKKIWTGKQRKFSCYFCWFVLPFLRVNHSAQAVLALPMLFCGTTLKLGLSCWKTKCIVFYYELNPLKHHLFLWGSCVIHATNNITDYIYKLSCLCDSNLQLHVRLIVPVLSYGICTERTKAQAYIRINTTTTKFFFLLNIHTKERTIE